MSYKIELLVVAILFIVAAAVLFFIPQTPPYVAEVVLALGLLMLAAWVVLYLIVHSRNR